VTSLERRAPDQTTFAVEQHDLDGDVPALNHARGRCMRGAPDSGRTWSVLSGGVAPSPEVVVASPAFTADAFLLAGTAHGLLRSQDAGQSWQLALLGGSAIAGIVALSVTSYVCYHFAKRTIALLGDNGVNVVVRLSAFILLCIGIQVLWTGYSGLVVVR